MAVAGYEAAKPLCGVCKAPPGGGHRVAPRATTRRRQRFGPGILKEILWPKKSGEVLAVVRIWSPWIRYAATAEGREYLAMVSYFRLGGIGDMPRFLWNALRVGRQPSRSEGLVCYSTGARLGALEFWSVSFWEDERALMGFVRASPHSEIMEEMRPRVRRSEFVRCGIGGSNVPPYRRETEGLLRRKLAVGDDPAA